MLSKDLITLLNKTLYNMYPEVIYDTSAHNNLNGFAIQTIEISVIAAITSNASTAQSLVGESLPAGITIYIPNITSITLTSGAVIVYQSEK